MNVLSVVLTHPTTKFFRNEKYDRINQQYMELYLCFMKILGNTIIENNSRHKICKVFKPKFLTNDLLLKGIFIIYCKITLSSV